MVAWHYFDVDVKNENERTAWSWAFVGTELAITLFARISAIFLASGIGCIFTGGLKNWHLNFYELSVISLSGSIRGAVAFALVWYIK